MQKIIMPDGVIVEIPDDAEIIQNQAPLPSSRITKLAFRNRFTFSEKVAIETAADSDAVVRVLLKDQEAATFIDLARQDTQHGVQLLVSKNLITAARSAEILSLDIQSAEAYSG